MRSHAERGNEAMRAGFTLIELLVVMALIALVATLAVMFFPSAATANREANAAAASSRAFSTSPR